MTTVIDEVLIIGASTRAAAFSASRAGLRPRCMDLFADSDLAERFPVVRFDPDREADDLERIASSFGCPHWLYTGSMEGRPELVERLERLGRLLGNGPEILRRVRDPWRVSASLSAVGLPTPPLRTASEGKGPSGRWLRKSRASAGGMGVAWAGATAEASGDEYYQEFVDGETCSALFVAAAGRARLIGTALQLPGPAEAPFLYRGSLAPWPLDAVLDDLQAMGRVLAADFDLVGLFGVDFIVKDGVPWVLEVNPRYTASVEIHEAALKRPLLTEHVRACLDREVGTGARPTPECSTHGKCIVYAPRRTTFLGRPNLDWRPEDDIPPPHADVPAEGAVIEAGEPVITIFASDASAETCREILERRAAEMRDQYARDD